MRKTDAITGLPSWAEPAWRRNLSKFFGRLFGGIGVAFAIIALPALILLATWLFNIALDLHMTFGEHLQATTGFAIITVIIGVIADQ